MVRKDSVKKDSFFRKNIHFFQDELNNCKESIEEHERKAFSIDGVEPRIIEKIKSEYIRLTATLAFDCDLDTKEYSSVNMVLKELGDLFCKIDNNPLLIDAIKKLIVYIDLQIGCKLSFYSTFQEMLLSGELTYDYYELEKQGLYNCKSLLTTFYMKSYEKINGNKNYSIDETNKNLKISDWLNQKRIDELLNSIEKIKKTDLKNYYNYRTILYQIFERINEIDSMQDILFVRKIIALLEYCLNIESKDTEIVQEMINSNEMNLYYESVIFEEDIDLDYLKDRLHYQGGVYGKGKGK